jgi:hypothetical protein
MGDEVDTIFVLNFDAETPYRAATCQDRIILKMLLQCLMTGRDRCGSSHEQLLRPWSCDVTVSIGPDCDWSMPAVLVWK